MSTRRALITGVTGQDGAYLSRFLLGQGYDVYGTTCRHDLARLHSLGVAERVRVVAGDLGDVAKLESILRDVQPDEVYNLAAQSSVAASFADPLLTSEVDALGALRLLEAVRRAAPQARFFQASSGEMFGDTEERPQRETTPFRPGTPYAVAKLFAHGMTIAYRRSHGLFACSGILFNHESPLRGPDFVTRKIARGAARIKKGLEHTLALGNLDVRRDWGFAGDYVRAMWLMLQQDEADDYVIATGESHTVREFVELAFAHVGLLWESHVRQDPALFRPADAGELVGDASKARRVLGWQPQVTFAELVAMMVEAELGAP